MRLVFPSLPTLTSLRAHLRALVRIALLAQVPLLAAGVGAVRAQDPDATVGTGEDRHRIASDDHVPGRRLVELNTFGTRRTLLEALRRSIARRDRAAVAALVARLEREARAGRVAFERELDARTGARVLEHYWIVDAVLVEVDEGTAPVLARLPGVRRVFRDRVRLPHVHQSTNDFNHRMDTIQKVEGLTGNGTALALLDSGLDLNSGSTGKVHPALLTMDGKASRVVASYGIAASGDVEDRLGHGSEVAGVAIGADWGFRSLVQSDHGFAPGADIVNYKITVGSNPWTSSSTLVAAWQAVLTDRVKHGIDVALNPYSGDPDPTSLPQQAIDIVAWVGDVVCVTSAGNDGDWGDPPTQDSQSNANGLVVGAVHGTFHRLASFSSYGPLPGDPGRFFPDLMGVGVAMRTVAIDRPTSISLPLDGTSFSAPAVAGTAAVMRAAVPSLDALATRALILNTVEDLVVKSGESDRNRIGLGLLRSDLAVRAARKAGSVLHDLIDISQQTARVHTLQCTRGKSYAATAAWWRTDFGTASWDDLDLRIVDPNGRVLAWSRSPRNLYERALWTAAVSGPHRIEVRASNVTAPTGTVGYALALGENLGGGRQPGSHERIGAGCPGHAQDPAAGPVYPASATAAGNSRTRVPFSWLPCRVHQVVPHAVVGGKRTLTGIAARRDEESPGGEAFRIDLTIDVGYSSRAPNGLSTKFADNPLPGSMKRVLDVRKLDVRGSEGVPASPGSFELVIPFTTPFAADTGAGKNLLLELRLLGNDRQNRARRLWWDAVEDSSTVGRVYSSGDVNAIFGIVDDRAAVIALLDGTLRSIAPDLQAVGNPQPGNVLDVVLCTAPARASAALLHGFSSERWGSVSLPLDLASIGAPGCSLFIAPLSTTALGADDAGAATVPVAIPALPDLTGTRFHHQFVILDPAANAIGLSLTNGGEATIGG